MADARLTDPLTSHEAAASITMGGTRLVQLSILAILDPGLSEKWPACTDEQIMSAARATYPEIAHYSDTSFRSRRAELVKLGHVEQSPGWYGSTRSGRRANLWRLTKAGFHHLHGVPYGSEEHRECRLDHSGRGARAAHERRQQHDALGRPADA